MSAYGASERQELSQHRITLDARPFSERIGAWLAYPRHYAKVQIGLALCAIPLACFWLAFLLASIGLHLWFHQQRQGLPMRMPHDLGGIDPSLDVVKRTPNGRGERVEQHAAEGIFYLGNQRSQDRTEQMKELWVTNSDARTHMLLMGATGSGKTVTLLSLCSNALTWGSGFFYSDGKADNSLHAAVWSLCRRFGREDDYLVLNFMTGGADPYKKRKSTEKSSNGANPWFEGSPDFLSQLSSSLLPKASGDGAQWQQKAVNMMDALIRTLCYERAAGHLTLSVGVIREYLALPNLVKLYLKGKRGEIPEFAFLPIKAYLETGLPGFKPDLADKPDKWEQTVWDQHGYLTGQYARTLSMLVDTYGHIFKDQYSEVDMMDVLLNRRILVVMIPTLEKSSQEAANLGKLVVSSIRLMMAMNLGHTLEGSYADVIATKATNSPAPYIIAMDELGYYFAEGIALMFAQARSLGFMMIAAGQDFAAMAKGENKEEVDSIIANTKIKYTLALEDPDKTLDVFKKVAGQAITVETGSYEGSVNPLTATNYRQNLSGSIQRRDRIELQELKALKEMEGVLIFKDQVIRARSFTWFHSAKFSALPFRLNRFLQVDAPTLEALTGKLAPRQSGDPRFKTIDRMMEIIQSGQAPDYPRIVDPVADAIRAAYRRIETHNPNETPINRGIAYYVAAIRAMRAHTPDAQGRYWEPDKTAASSQNVEMHNEAMARNPVYHDPPLQEKKAAESSMEAPPERLFPEAADRTEQTADASAPEEPAAHAALDAFLHQAGELHMAEGQTPLPEAAPVEPVTASESPCTPASTANVAPQPSAAASDAQTFEQRRDNTVIGFTEETAETFVQIERALGNDTPLQSMQRTEAEISEQLTWTKPVEDMSPAELDRLFDRIEAHIQQSASTVET